MEVPVYYFSYGSNMSVKRLQQRIPSAVKAGTGMLFRHVLCFHKTGRLDGTGKCDARETGNPEHCVYGVLYRVSAADRHILNQIEGLAFGYDVKDVVIRLDTGSEVTAYTYYATRIDPTLKPLDWYKQHVLRGARENSLPEAYLHAIEAIESVMDTDSERRARELSIYLA